MPVSAPARMPENTVTSTTAGKYGVKNTSGRIWTSPHRPRVASVRQSNANPMLNSSEGWEIPRQPRRNSSINFAMCLSLHVTSKSKIWPPSKQNGHFER